MKIYNISGLPRVVGKEYVYERPDGVYSHTTGKAKCEEMGMRLPVINEEEYTAFVSARCVSVQIQVN